MLIKHVTAVNRRVTCNDTVLNQEKITEIVEKVLLNVKCAKKGHSAEICEFRGEKDKHKNKEQKEEHNKERRIPEYNEEKQKNVQMLTQMWNVMMNLCQQKN